MRRAGRSERLGCNALRLPMNCLALFSQERSSAKLRHASRDRLSAPMQARRRSAIQNADGVIRNHIQRTCDRKRRDRRAARQRFELNDAEGVGEAREHEDVRRRQMRGQILAGFFAEESDLRVAALQFRPLRPVPDHDLRSRQVQCQKCFEVLFDRDAADRHENGSGQIQFDRMVGPEQIGVDPARPAAELPKPFAPSSCRSDEVATIVMAAAA